MEATREPDAATVAQKLPFEGEHLDALERMRMLETYYAWVHRRIAKHLGRRVLDAGCGVGNFSALIEPGVEYVLAGDLSPQNIEAARERFRGRERIEVAQLDLEADLAHLKDRRFDTIVCLDVVEHIEGDVELFRRFRDLVEPGGHLLVKVPACPWLYGTIDVASQHYRRYSPVELRQKAALAGWEPVKVFYMNIFGVLPYFVKSRLLKKRGNFSRTFPLWQLRAIRRIIPVLEIADRIAGPPIGQSAILIARRPTAEAPR